MSGVAYVVTHGSYSDYSVDAVFDDKALAEAHVAKLRDMSRSQDYEVEEFPLYSELPEYVSMLSMSMRVGAIRGTTRKWTAEPVPEAGVEYVFDEFTYTDIYVDPSPNELRACRVRGGKVGVDPSFYVDGIDHDRVRKVYGEKLAEYKAHYLGLI